MRADRDPPAAARRGCGLALGLAILPALAVGPGRPAGAAEPARTYFKPQAPPETRHRLAPGLTFGAELEVAVDRRGRFDLMDRGDGDPTVWRPELSLAWTFDPLPAVRAFLNLTLGREFVVAAAGAADADLGTEGAVAAKEAYLHLQPLPEGLAVRLGRQTFEDERQWLYDEELDAVRVRYRRGPVEVEVAAGRSALSRPDLVGRTERPDVDLYALHVRGRAGEALDLEAFALLLDDRGGDRGRPTFLGLLARGEPVEDLDAWLHLARAGGREPAGPIRGWGVDAGATYELPRGPRPALTLGVAFGSGDPGPGGDRGFRQTGLQGNEADFGGATSVKTYGEVLDPELANLAVLTAGLGIRPAERLSVDLVYHAYLQHRAAPALRGAALGSQPSGRSRTLGQEVDLVVGLVDLGDRLDLRGVAGYFFPGAAFPGAAGAWTVGVEAQLRF